MPSELRSYRPGHGTVVAYLALFVALGGTSYGLATGSIDGREIKNNSVGTRTSATTASGRGTCATARCCRGTSRRGSCPAGPQGRLDRAVLRG